MKLVTGGLGFIGSHLVDLLVSRGEEVLVMDSFNYAANYDYYIGLKDRGVAVELVNLAHSYQVEYFFNQKYTIDTVYHLAAETHVDRSITNVSPFVESNIEGTLNLLKACAKSTVEKFIHVSTDEVYGTVAPGTSTDENSPYHPRNPYAATKAASDHLVTAWHHTYGIPAMITHCSNNYGPRQYGEKMIPTIIRSLTQNQPVPIYGDGQQIRDWLYVRDHCEALILVAKQGRVGETYNIGAGHDHEITNLELVQMICDIMGKPRSLIKHVEDRKGHDRRYSIDSTKIRQTLGWSDRTTLEEGLALTLPRA
jgi:dTDP-glucose 4,6-dehydratase